MSECEWVGGWVGGWLGVNVSGWVGGWVGMTYYPSLPQIARLPFQFPYYGHLVNTVAVTTGGTYSFPE